MRTKSDEPFIINAREPNLGVGMLVKKDAERRTYRFASGEVRSFKEAYCQLYIKPALRVAPEVAAKLLPAKVVTGPVAPLAVNDELEALIRARPDDPAPYLVYADWLLQRGDPRGNLITVQSQLADAPRKKELLLAEKKLLDTHRAYFIPAALDASLRLARRGGARCEVTWDHGFFAKVRLARSSTAAAQDIDLDVVAESVLAHPSAKFMRSLVLGPLGTREYSYGPIIAAIAETRHPLLDEIHVGDFGPTDIELASTRAGNVGPLFRAAPAMRKLTINAGLVRFEGKLAHDNLRELRVTTIDVAPGYMRGLFEANLPALESLSFVTEGLVLETAQLVKLGEARWPALRHLVLRGLGPVKAIVDVLIESPLTARLVSLDLGCAPTTMKKLIAKHPHLELRERSHKRFPISDSDAVRRAPDPESMAAARKIARADKWLVLGYDPGRNRVWGEYEGREHYYVYARLRGRDVGCDCGSPKYPCKHALALLLLAANQHDFPEAVVPDVLVRNASRERPRYGRDGYDW
jgi:uncharacterized protein (TIGR02996 family)